MKFDETAERKAYEETAFDEYLTNETSGRANAIALATARGERPPRFKPMMTFANFTKRNPDLPEVYLLVGLDAGWWGWRTRAQHHERVTDKILRERLMATVEVQP